MIFFFSLSLSFAFPAFFVFFQGPLFVCVPLVAGNEAAGTKGKVYGRKKKRKKTKNKKKLIKKTGKCAVTVRTESGRGRFALCCSSALFSPPPLSILYARDCVTLEDS
jgi:hypothetical protein